MAILLAIIAGGLALRLCIAGRSLWEDEFFSVYWVKRGLAYIWGPGLLIEANPPLYYTLLYFWTRLFGFGEIALRLPSILASAATIPIVYRIGAILFERRAGLISAALFAVTPVQICWSDEARSYGLQTLLAGLCLWGITLFFTGERAARRKGLALYIIAAILLSWTHYTQVFFIAACALAGMGFHLRQSQGLRPFLLANVAIFLATAAEIPLMLQVGGNPGLLMIRVRPADMPGNFAIMLAGTSWPLLASLLTGGIVFCFWRIWKQAASPVTRLVLIEIPALFVALLFMVNFFHTAFVARVLVALAIPVSLAVSKALCDVQRGALRSASLAAIVAFYMIILPHDLYATPFREVFAQMAAKFHPGDVVIFGPFDRIGALGYYRPEIVAQGVDRWRPNADFPVTSEDRFWNETFSATTIDSAGIQSLITQHRTVWLILLEDDRLVANYRSTLYPAPAVFADDKLLHVYLWQGSAPK